MRGRKRTGTIERHGDHWDVRPTLADGSRGNRVCQAPAMTEAEARKTAAALTALAAAQGTTRQQQGRAPSSGVSVADWSLLWCEDRERRGLSSVDADRARLKKWVLPRLDPALGTRPMVEITSDDLGLLVEDLDERVRARELSWKTAKLVWMIVRKMFDDACRSKTRALRIRTDNPALTVRGPDDGVRRAKSYLYPSEFLAVMQCPRVPIRWRRLFALQVYLYTRAGETEALGVEDVDTVRGVVHVHRSVDRLDGEKETKSNTPRRFAVEPHLKPMLEVLVEDARREGRARLVRMPPQVDQATRLRQYLKWAGVTRAELFANDRTRKRITFHDLRATGITWMAIRGDEPLKIMHRAGHASFATTQIYIREAEALEFLREEVFPALPPELLLPCIPPPRAGGYVQGREIDEALAISKQSHVPGRPAAFGHVRKAAPHLYRPIQAVSARNDVGRAELGQFTTTFCSASPGPTGRLLYLTKWLGDEARRGRHGTVRKLAQKIADFAAGRVA